MTFYLTDVKTHDASKYPRGDFHFDGELFHFGYENDQKNEPAGTPKLIANHWTAGAPNYLWDGYNYCVSKVNGKVYVFKTLGNNQKNKHLWGRNTGTIGLAFCRMANHDLPEWDEQLTMALLNAELCCWKNINPHEKITLQKKTCDKNATKIWDVPGTITVDTVSDHKSYAKEDGYGRFRYDIDKLMPGLLKQTRTFYDELKAGKRQFLFKSIL